MNSIPVKMCCHSGSGDPKFRASIGDAILVRTPDGAIRELTVSALTASILSCEDTSSVSVNVPVDSVLAVYIP